MMKPYYAKSNKYPLKYHLQDTYETAKCFFEYNISTLKQYALFCCYIHDIGKATPMHEQYMLNNKDTLRHPETGYYILKELGIPECYAEIISMHHGWIFTKNNNLSKFKNEFTKEDYKEHIRVWKEILNEALTITNLTIEELKPLTLVEQLQITGYVIFCDWIASNPNFFEYTYNDQNHKQAIEKAKDKLRPLFKKEKLLEFQFEKLNSTQEGAIKTAKKVQDGLYIIESPTGSGKTEAGLMLASQITHNGIIYCLPTQATTKAQAERLRNEAPNLSYRYGKGHSLNSYFDTRKDLAIFNSFYICTIDQLLLLCRDTRYFPLLYAALENKVIILDEVHSYDILMSRYIDKLISISKYIKCTIILLSATIPFKIKKGYVSRYNVNKEERKKITTAYPQITAIGYDKRELNILNTPWNEIKNYTLNQINYQSEYDCIDLCKIITEQLLTKDSNICTGIILNTVNAAQAVYLSLKLNPLVKGRRIILCHSQFLIEDRLSHETDVITYCGKNSTYEQRKGVIVIGTQTLEQALDIDFDYEIQELSPIDLVYQRLGRLGRHKRTNRPVNTLECTLLIPQDGAFSVYDSELIQRTAKTLSTKNTITTPDDVSKDINEVYKGYAAKVNAETKMMMNRVKININQAESILEYLTDDQDLLKPVDYHKNDSVRAITEAKHNILLINKNDDINVICKDKTKIQNATIRVSSSVKQTLKDENLLKPIDFQDTIGYDYYECDIHEDLPYLYSKDIGLYKN